MRLKTQIWLDSHAQVKMSIVYNKCYIYRQYSDPKYHIYNSSGKLNVNGLQA